MFENPRVLLYHDNHQQIQLLKFSSRHHTAQTPTMSSLSSCSIFRNNFPSTSITSSTLSVPALRRGTNFARLLSRWKIFQVAHFAQKTRFRFGLKFLAQKRSLLSLGIKRGATRSIMVKTTCVQKKRAGVSFLDGSQTFCGRREEKKL